MFRQPRTNVAKKLSGRTPTARMADFMCFAIYSANLAYSRVYKPVLDALGLTYPQYLTLICLWEEDHQTVKGLSEKLFLESSTTTPMLKRLEVMGYLTRKRDPMDERNLRVSLTSSGRRLRERGFGFGELTMKAAGLTDAEFAVTQKAIMNLRNNLVKASAD
jgi:DNA-binding MarR family transcriptional regulator